MIYRILIVFIVLCVSNVYAATYYVAKDGGGSECSQANPCLTITVGMSKLASGDILEVSEGTYNENLIIDVPSGTSSAYTTIRAATGETVWVRPTTFNSPDEYQRIMQMGFGGQHHVKIERINLDGSGFPNDGIHSVTGFTTSNTFNISSGNPTHNLIFDGMEIKETRGNTSFFRHNHSSIMRNTHHHHTNTSVADGSGAGCFYFQENDISQDGGIIENNIFEYCDSAIHLAGRHNSIIRNNIMRHMGYGNDGNLGYGIITRFHPVNNLIYNNIIHRTKIGRAHV